MNEGKINVLIKWVNSIGVGKPITNLGQVSSMGLLPKILHEIDNCERTTEETNSNDNEKETANLCKLISYLEDFYQQPLTTVIDMNKIIGLNTLEIGKVLSLLLYCSVQGENANIFVDKITKMDEDTQYVIKIIIEAVLKEVECGKINIENIGKVLHHSGSVSDSQEYTSSPKTSVGLTSPILFHDSPIKALMASPQMRSTASQLIISKLYKKLNQLEITINSQQRIKVELEQQLEEKNILIEDQALKIGFLSKDVARVPGLEEEVQSLSCFEREVEEMKIECERLKKKVNELQTYKDQCLKLEKEFSTYVAEKDEEKRVFEKCLKDIKRQDDHQILNLLSSLKERDTNNNHMESKLLEASSTETKLKKRLNQLEKSYKADLEQLKLSLDESNRVKNELCDMKDKELQVQMSRESDLKKCFKEKLAGLETTIDQLQLENANFHHEIDAQQKLLDNLRNELALTQQDFRGAVCKSDNLSADLDVVRCENDKLIKEQEAVSEKLRKSQAETIMVKDAINDLEKDNKLLTAAKIQLLEKMSENTALLEKFKGKIRDLENEMMKEKEAFQNEINSYQIELSLKSDNITMISIEHERCKESLADKESEIKKLQEMLTENASEISRRDKEEKELQERYSALIYRTEEEKQIFDEKTKECQEFQCSLKSLEENNALLHEDNLSLKDKLQEFELMSVKCEKLQKLLTVSNTEKASIIQEKLSIEDKVEGLSAECLNLKNSLNSTADEFALLMQKHLPLADKVQEMENLKTEVEKLRTLLKSTNAQNMLLMQELTPLKHQVEEVEPLRIQLGNLQNILQAANEEKRLIKAECSSLKQTLKGLEPLKTECGKLQNSLQSRIQKNTLMVEERLLLEEKVKEMELECENLKRASLEEKTSLSKEFLSLKKKVEELEIAKIDCDEKNAIMKEESLILKQQIGEFEALKTQLCEVRNTLQVVNEEKVSIMDECSSLKKTTEILEGLKGECENLQNSLKSSNEEKSLMAEKHLLLGKEVRKMEVEYENLQSTSLEEKVSLSKECLSLKKKVEELEIAKIDCDEKNAIMKEESSILKQQIGEFEALKTQLCEVRNTLQVANEEKVSIMDECSLLKNTTEILEGLKGECENLQASLKSSNEEKSLMAEKHLLLEKEVRKMEVEYENLQSTSFEEKVSLSKECLSLKKKVEELEIVKIHHKRLQDSLQLVNEENAAIKEESLLLKRQVGEIKSLKIQLDKLQNTLQVVNDEKVSIKEECSSLKRTVQELGHLKTECEKLQSSLKLSNEENSSVIEKHLLLEEKVRNMKLEYENLENTNSQEKASSLKKMGEELKVVKIDCERLQDSLKSVNEEKTLLMEKLKKLETLQLDYEDLQKNLTSSNEEMAANSLSVKKKVEDLEKMKRECEKLNNSLKLVNQEKTSMIEEHLSAKRRIKELESVEIELERLQQSLKSSDSEKAHWMEKSFKTKIEGLEAVEMECENVKNSLTSPKEESYSLIKECLSSKETVPKPESQVLDLENLQNSLKLVNEEKALVVKEHLLPNEKIVKLEPLQLEYQQKTATEELSVKQVEDAKDAKLETLKRSKELQICLTTSNNEKASIVEGNVSLQKKVEKPETLKMEYEKLQNCLKSSNKEKAFMMEESFLQNNDIEELNSVKIDSGNLANPLKLANQGDVYSMEERMLLKNNIESLEAEREKLQVSLRLSNNEKALLHQECLLLKKKVEDLEPLQKHYEEQLACSHSEMLKSQKKVETVEKENFTLKEWNSKLEEDVIKLEKKLTEEEFISKRLGMEIRSLEAQVQYADRQLRQKPTPNNALVNQKDQDTSKLEKIGQLSVSMPSVISTDCAPSDSNLVCRKIHSKVDVGDKNEKENVNGNNHEEDVSKSEKNSENAARIQRSVKRQMRRRSALYQTKDETDIDEKEKSSTVGGTFLMVNQFTNEDDEPTLFGGDFDWNRLLELKKRNATCLPHMRSSYPVETQVRSEEEIQEEELKSGSPTSCLTRKRLRDNNSDSTLSVTFQIPHNHQTTDSQELPRSKSDERIGKRFSERIAAKFAQKSKSPDEQTLLSSTSSLDQTENCEDLVDVSRRESIAFSVDITPRKKPRSSLQRGIHRSFGKSDLSLGALNNKKKDKLQSLKKFPLQRKSNMKCDKKPLTLRNSKKT